MFCCNFKHLLAIVSCDFIWSIFTEMCLGGTMGGITPNKTIINPNVDCPRWCKYDNTLQLIEHTARQSLTFSCSCILPLFNYIHNNDDSFIKKLKKNIGRYQPRDLHCVSAG